MCLICSVIICLLYYIDQAHKLLDQFYFKSSYEQGQITLCHRSLWAPEHLEFHMGAGNLGMEMPHFQRAGISLECHPRLRGLLTKERSLFAHCTADHRHFSTAVQIRFSKPKRVLKPQYTCQCMLSVDNLLPMFHTRHYFNLELRY